MSKDANSRSNPTLFAEDSLVSHSPKLENSLPKTTPVTSGRKCLDLSGNAGPLGFVEKTLLGSSNWAWTKYSLTWKAKATPQGRLIYQLARLAPRTSDNGSGLLHTPTATANQTSPSMEPGNWVSGLWPTPTTPTGGGERSGDRSGTGSLNYMARSGQLTGPKITGSLNPQWVAWLMGYPTEYLSCVPWATRSFRKSRKK
jgi:hypothetical protein